MTVGFKNPAVEFVFLRCGRNKLLNWSLFGLGSVNEVSGTNGQFPRIERLGDVVVSTDFQSENTINIVISACYEHKGYISLFPDFPGQNKTVLSRQIDIEQNEVNLMGG